MGQYNKMYGMVDRGFYVERIKKGRSISYIIVDESNWLNINELGAMNFFD